MNNQITTTLILVCLIALFSFRHYTLEINQSSQGTEIVFGNISISFGGAEADATQPLNSETGCTLEFSELPSGMIPAETATLNSVTGQQIREIEIVIETLSNAYDLRGGQPESILDASNQPNSSQDLNHHPK